MANEHILYLPRSDSLEEYVLVNVSSGGPSPLDLKLLATEGEYPYMTTTRHSRVSKLRDKRNQLSDYQWEDVLRSILLQHRTQGSEASSIEKLEVFATLAQDQLSIVFRNNISGIVQKLGEIVFRKDENQELDITRWAGTAVERSNRLDVEVRDLTARYDEQSEKMKRLNNQLEALIRAKSEHENTLLQKFRELLNTKKLKIREQQRLLASARFDPRQTARAQRVCLEPKKSRTATASRAGKRKVSRGESSEESGLEGKTPKQNPENDLSEQTNTPEHSDQKVTEDESSEYQESKDQAATLDSSLATGVPRGAIGEEMQSDTPFEQGVTREQTKRPLTENESTPIQEAKSEDEETDDDEL